MVPTMEKVHPLAFEDEVEAAMPVDSRLRMCIQCGSCGGSCPSGADMDHTPRALFAMIRDGKREAVLRSNAPWYCVSCYYCTVRCPEDVHITDLMYALKRLAIQEGFYRESDVPQAADFSETFIGYVERYGRSFELGLATRFHLRHHPLEAVGMASMGLDLWRKKRMTLTPRKIRGIDQLRAILARAHAIGHQGGGAA